MLGAQGHRQVFSVMDRETGGWTCPGPWTEGAVRKGREGRRKDQACPGGPLPRGGQDFSCSPSGAGSVASPEVGLRSPEPACQGLGGRAWNGVIEAPEEVLHGQVPAPSPWGCEVEGP